MKLRLIFKTMTLGLLLAVNTGLAMQTYGPTKANETLWSIASRHHPAKVSVDQTALAIVKLNPKAFQGADYVLRSHSYLKLPTTALEVKSALAPASLSSSNSKAKVAAKPTKSKPAPARPVAVNKSNVQAVKPSRPVKTASQLHQSPPKHWIEPQYETQTTQVQVAQLSQQLAAANQQIATLQQQANGAADSFPWASLWFILWALTAISLFMIYRRYKSSEVIADGQPNIDAQVNEARGKTEPIIISVSEKAPENPFEQGELDIPVTEGEAPESSVDSNMEQDQVEGLEEKQATPEVQSLLQQIETDPYNLELRMELLELYADLSDQAGFDQQSHDMVNHNLMMEGDEVWTKVRSLYLNTWIYA
ncbi:MAG: ATPase [Gammaproteobacteria bacterium]|nr:ATPase [Gammaproteobacteria bacterium]